MVQAFLFLTFCSVKNRAVRRLRRLREPRYLVGAVFGLLYLYFAFFRWQMGTSHRPRRAGRADFLGLVAGPWRDPVELAASLVLIVVIAAAWVVPASRAAITFTPAELQWFFPAPLGRRDLLQYKLLRSQLGVFFGSVIASLFMGRLLRPSGWMTTLGIWALFATLQLHLLGVSFARASLVEHGRSGIRRSQWALAGGAIGATALAVGVWKFITRTHLSGDPERLLQNAVAVGHELPLSILLFPVRLAVRPLLSAMPLDFLAALGPALLLLALNYAWVIRSDTAFEEASVEASERRARARAAGAPSRAIRRNVRPPFRLAPLGRPEPAIFWKNLIMAGRFLNARLLAIALFGPSIVILLTARTSTGETVVALAAGVTYMLLGLVVMLTFMGPQMFRNDLRQDLLRLDVLKSWPIPGRAIVAGEMLAPIVLLAVIQWGLIAIALSLRLWIVKGGLAPATWVWLAASAVIVAPAIGAAGVAIQNAAVLLFPSWVSLGLSRARGIEAMGQRLLMLAGSLLVVIVGLLPGCLVAGILFALTYRWLGLASAVPAAAIVAALLLVEIGLAAWWLGGVFDRTEPTAIDAA